MVNLRPCEAFTGFGFRSMRWHGRKFQATVHSWGSVFLMVAFEYRRASGNWVTGWPWRGGNQKDDGGVGGRCPVGPFEVERQGDG